MRLRRIRVDDRGCYYHLINRAAGSSADRPFGDNEKRKLTELLSELSEFYTIEILAYTIMSNHLHIVAFAPSEMPDAETAAKRYNAYYAALGKKREKQVKAGKAHPYPVKWIGPESADIEQVRERLRDISRFMKDLLQRFTQWHNKRTNRRGPVWADRFKSIVLEGKKGTSAVWSCIKYIELNAVRAGIVEDPADYRFSSWGVWCGRGKHPYAENFFRHVRHVLGERADKLTDKQLRTQLRAEMRRTIVAESEASMEQVIEAYEAAKKEVPLLLRMDRRVRYWTDGAVIGSKAFVQEVSDQVYGGGKRKRFAKGQLSDDESLFFLRRLRL